MKLEQIDKEKTLTLIFRLSRPVAPFFLGKLINLTWSVQPLLERVPRRHRFRSSQKTSQNHDCQSSPHRTEEDAGTPFHVAVQEISQTEEKRGSREKGEKRPSPVAAPPEDTDEERDSDESGQAVGVKNSIDDLRIQ